jgi:hypothetical protein
MFQSFLKGGVVGNDDGSVTARPETVTAFVKPSNFPGDIGVHKLHEQRKLVGVGGTQQ